MAMANNEMARSRDGNLADWSNWSAPSLEAEFFRLAPLAEGPEALISILEQLFRNSVGKQEHTVFKGKNSSLELDDIISCAQHALARQERRMARLGFPDIRDHARDHQILLRHLIVLRRMLDVDGFTHTLVLKLVAQWVDSHERIYDQDFRKFQKTHTLSTEH